MTFGASRASRPTIYFCRLPPDNVRASASSLLHLAGAELGPEALEGALEALCAEPADAIGERVGLDPVRVRLMPAGVLVLAELARQLRQPFRICKGGLREGVIMEMIERHP